MHKQNTNRRVLYKGTLSPFSLPTLYGAPSNLEDGYTQEEGVTHIPVSQKKTRFKLT